MKRILAVGVTVYLLMAVVTAVLMKQAVPALNGLGMAYVGLTWGPAIACNATDLCNVVPRRADWMFTFND